MRTQADRDDDLAIGRELERKDALIEKMRTVLTMGIQLCESGGHGRGDKCPNCHFMREAQKVIGLQQNEDNRK